MYILDTNVISEIRKAKRGRADKNVIAWAAGVPPSTMFLSVITILELEIGVLQVERRDNIQGKLLRAWLDNHVIPAFPDRILGIDMTVAQRCAKLHVPHRRTDRDALIAATALVHGMTIVTRNVTDFESTGVDTHNPWN
jgi:toxin FitB